jgi:hypothetical protein
MIMNERKHPLGVGKSCTTINSEAYTALTTVKLEVLL